MQDLGLVVITPEFRSRVDALAERLGDVHVIVAPRWANFAASLGLGIAADAAGAPGAARIVVGSPADVLKHAAVETNEFGFVMPTGQTAGSLMRAGRTTQWSDNVTLDLWRAGWSLLSVDRLRLAKDDVVLEFVIGNARRTPLVSDGTLID